MGSFFTDLVGSKPTVPDLPSLDLSTEQQKALTANQNAIPGSEKIATGVDLFNQQQIDKMLTHVIPNYQGITGKIGQNLYDLNRGVIPQDVDQALQLSDASKMFQGGFAGTGMGRNLVARDLGLTSLNLMQQGLASTESWMKTAASLYGPGMFNVTSMFVTPTQQAAFDTQERNAQFQRTWMQNQINAMPAPWAMDLKQFVYRAMSAYSGTPVQNNPYSTPGSFTSGTPSPAAREGGDFNFGNSFSNPADYGGEESAGKGGGAAGILGLIK